jgi:hypothetical protein
MAASSARRFPLAILAGVLMKATVLTAVSLAALMLPVLASAHHVQHSPHSHIKPVSVSKGPIGSAGAAKSNAGVGDALPATQSGHRAPGDSLDPMYHGGG